MPPKGKTVYKSNKKGTRRADGKNSPHNSPPRDVDPPQPNAGGDNIGSCQGGGPLPVIHYLHLII